MVINNFFLEIGQFLLNKIQFKNVGKLNIYIYNINM